MSALLVSLLSIGGTLFVINQIWRLKMNYKSDCIMRETVDIIEAVAPILQQVMMQMQEGEEVPRISLGE